MVTLNLQDGLFHPPSLNLVNALFHFSPLCSVGDLPSFIHIPNHSQHMLSLPPLTGCVFSHVYTCCPRWCQRKRLFSSPLPRISTPRVPSIPFFSILSYILLLFNSSVSTASFALTLQSCCYLKNILKSWQNFPDFRSRYSRWPLEHLFLFPRGPGLWVASVWFQGYASISPGSGMDYWSPSRPSSPGLDRGWGSCVT